MQDLPYIQRISVKHDKIEDKTAFPFSIPAINKLDALQLGKQVTFFVGENGTGKSTLLEAIAIALDFNPEGGSKNFRFGTRVSHSSLHEYLRIVKSAIKPKDGYFLRAESYYNVATHIEELDKEDSFGPPIMDAYGNKSLHEQSHGESFMALILNRFRGKGIYILDEPEAALSPIRQFAMLQRMKQLIADDSQFIIATHSPILLAYPSAVIYQIGDNGFTEVAYTDTEHYKVTKAFLENPDNMLEELFKDF